MGIRFRKSVRLGKGVRFNVSSRSVGMSFGVRGARYSVNSSGRRTTSVGIPGTGLYAVSTKGSGSRGAPQRGSSRTLSGGPPTSQSAPVTPDLAERVIPKAGLLASAAEKQFRTGLVAYLQNRWEDAVAAFESTVLADVRNVSDNFFLAATLTRLKRYGDAASQFEVVVASDIPLPDGLMQKYVPGQMTIELPITEHVSATVGFDSIGATLALAEVYQELGRHEEAIGLVQRLHEILPDDSAIRLSLADLLYDDDDFAGLVELTNGVENQDDVTLATLHLRAKGLANERLVEPAAEVLSACLRRTAARDPELLKEIRYNRAEAYELLGNSRKAKADWSKLVADDPFYRDARSRLEALA